MNIDARHDRIVAKRIEIGQKTNGIIVASPDMNETKDTCFGRVIAAGPGKRLSADDIIPMSVNVGDIIVYPARQPIKFNHADLRYDLLRDGDVIAVVSGDDVQELSEQDLDVFGQWDEVIKKPASIGS